LVTHTWRAERHRRFLRHHLMPHGHHSCFEPFTYYAGGVAGNIDARTDIIDLILSYV
jgi:hypothetical protein